MNKLGFVYCVPSWFHRLFDTTGCSDQCFDFTELVRQMGHQLGFCRATYYDSGGISVTGLTPTWPNEVGIMAFSPDALSVNVTS